MTNIAAAIKAVPKGKVITYGMVAECVGRNPAKENLVVAGALRKNPDMPGWHGVIGKVPKKSNRGRISIRLTMRDPERADRQRKRLESEGVTFDDAGHIDLSCFAVPQS